MHFTNFLDTFHDVSFKLDLIFSKKTSDYSIDQTKEIRSYLAELKSILQEIKDIVTNNANKNIILVCKNKIEEHQINFNINNQNLSAITEENNSLNLSQNADSPNSIQILALNRSNVLVIEKCYNSN